MADRFNTDPGPDPRAVAFLEAKGLKRSWRWPSMWGTEHAFAFTLAGVHRLDVLAAGRQLSTQAVRDGQTLEMFQAAFEERLKSLGFSGPQLVTQFPEGPRKVDLSAPSRVRVIYDTNVRQAYAASEWQAIQDTAADFPALQYHHTPQEHPRLQHEAFDGIVLPVDHPFWKTHFPPNGWFCKCFVLQVSAGKLSRGAVNLTSEAELKAKGFDPDPATWPIWRHEATGVEEPVPPGVTPGFGHNSGMARRQNLADLLARKLTGLDPDLARAAAADLANFPQFADLVASANTLGLQRAEILVGEVERLLAGGLDRAQADAQAQAIADARSPWPAEAWPVGVAPSELGAMGTGQTIVSADVQAIGQAADQVATTAADWTKVQQLLEAGQVWQGPGGELTLFGQFADAKGGMTLWSLRMAPANGTWRVLSLAPTSASQRDALTQSLNQVRAAADGLG